MFGIGRLTLNSARASPVAACIVWIIGSWLVILTAPPGFRTETRGTKRHFSFTIGASAGAATFAPAIDTTTPAICPAASTVMASSGSDSPQIAGIDRDANRLQRRLRRRRRRRRSIRRRACGAARLAAAAQPGGRQRHRALAPRQDRLEIFPQQIPNPLNNPCSLRSLSGTEKPKAAPAPRSCQALPDLRRQRELAVLAAEFHAEVQVSGELLVSRPTIDVVDGAARLPGIQDRKLHLELTLQVRRSGDRRGAARYGSKTAPDGAGDLRFAGRCRTRRRSRRVSR